jgi:hypothetical protein
MKKTSRAKLLFYVILSREEYNVNVCIYRRAYLFICQKIIISSIEDRQHVHACLAKSQSRPS